MSEGMTVELEGKTFIVLLNWGRLKKIMREMNKLDTENDALAVMELVEDTLLDIIKRIEGWDDEVGARVESLQQQIIVDEKPIAAIDSLTPTFIMNLWARVTGAGEDVTDGTTTIPLADSSEPKPESLPKESE